MGVLSYWITVGFVYLEIERKIYQHLNFWMRSYSSSPLDGAPGDSSHDSENLVSVLSHWIIIGFVYEHIFHP